MSGLFITMEGTDGSGKTTQIALLKDYLEGIGFSVALAREPGGTKIGEKIREIILDIDNKGMSYATEALLYSASRSELVKGVIMPELKKGNIVLCDRFLDSSLVYQGVGRELGIENIKNINEIATNGLSPDITFFLQLSSASGMLRKKKQKQLDRLEAEKEYFHKRVYYGYEKLVRENSDRIKKIDASESIQCVHKEIVKNINELFNIRGYIV